MTAERRRRSRAVLNVAVFRNGRFRNATRVCGVVDGDVLDFREVLLEAVAVFRRSNIRPAIVVQRRVAAEIALAAVFEAVPVAVGQPVAIGVVASLECGSLDGLLDSPSTLTDGIRIG